MNRNEFFQALTITRLNLRLTSAALEICTDDIDDIHVMISGSNTDAEGVRIAASVDALSVEQPVSALPKVASAPGNWLQITIRLPRTWKGAVDARTVSGWMNIRSFAGTDLSLDTVSGTIMANDLQYITVTIRSVTGDVKLNQVICDKCSLFSTTGSLSVIAGQMQKGSASSVTGTITLSLLAPFTDLSLNSISGDLCVDAPIRCCDAALRSVSGRIRTEGVSIREEGPKIRAATVTSDLDISNNIDESAHI